MSSQIIDLPFPSILEIETTTRCTPKGNCHVYCPNTIPELKAERGDHGIDPALFLDIIDQYAELLPEDFVPIISPHGYGEPLSDELLTFFAEYIAETIPNARLKIYTNGDGLTIAKFLELIEAGPEKTDFWVNTHTINTPLHINKLVDYARTNPELGSRLWLWNYYPSMGCFNTETSDGDLKEIASSVVLMNRCGLIEHPLANKPSHYCTGFKHMIVDWQGKVHLCSNDYEGKVIRGDLRKQHMRDVWNSPTFRQDRLDLQKATLRWYICQICNYVGPKPQ